MQSDDIFQITSGQLRAARALIRWSAEDLAENASLGVATVRRAEIQDGPLSTTKANAGAMRTALERAGIEFIAQNAEGGPGVRLRRVE